MLGPFHDHEADGLSERVYGICPLFFGLSGPSLVQAPHVMNTGVLWVRPNRSVDGTHTILLGPDLRLGACPGLCFSFSTAS